MNKILLLSIVFCLSFINYAQAEGIDHAIKYWGKQKDFLVFGEPTRIGSLDPRVSSDVHSSLILPLIFEPLVYLNQKQHLEPVLAKSWYVESNSRVLRLELRENHYFSDGSLVTSKDVVNALKSYCALGSKQAVRLAGISGCLAHASGKKANIGIFVINQHELGVELSGNPEAILYGLAATHTTIFKKENSSLIGSGPYYLAKKTDNYIVLKKNPYYQGSNTVKNNGVFIFGLDHKEIQSYLSRYKIDGLLMYQYQGIEGIRAKNYILINSNSNITGTLVLNNQRYPFNYEIVRKALEVEIYNHLNLSCSNGANKAYGVIPEGIGGSIENLSPHALKEISPDEVFNKVKKLSVQPVTVTVHELRDTANLCLDRQLKKFAKKYHINFVFKYHDDYKTLWPLYASHDYDAFVELYVVQDGEAYGVLQFFSKDGGHDGNILSDYVDNNLELSILAESSWQKFEFYRNVIKYIQRHAIVIPLYIMKHGNLMSTCLKGVTDNFYYNPYNLIPRLTRVKKC